MKTLFDVAIWHSGNDGEDYAFPLGAPDAWGGVIYPTLNVLDWTAKGTLPKGMEVTDVKPVKGNRIRCKLAGVTVNTADWAVK